jgi:hypothetical protein
MNALKLYNIINNLNHKVDISKYTIKMETGEMASEYKIDAVHLYGYDIVIDKTYKIIFIFV